MQHFRNDCVYITVAPNVRVRRPVLVWQSVYGKLPKKYVIIHKDGDRYNDDINNLEAITRAEMLRRNAQSRANVKLKLGKRKIACETVGLQQN